MIQKKTHLKSKKKVKMKPTMIPEVIVLLSLAVFPANGIMQRDSAKAEVEGKAQLKTQESPVSLEKALRSFDAPSPQVRSQIIKLNPPIALFSFKSPQ